MGYLLDLAYWFNSRPEPISQHADKIIISFISLLILIAIIIISKSYGERLKKYKPTLNKLVPFCFTNSVIGLYLIFVNQQLIPILRSRSWFLVWLIAMITWLFFIIKDYKKRVSKKESSQRDQEIKKYLP